MLKDFMHNQGWKRDAWSVSFLWRGCRFWVSAQNLVYITFSPFTVQNVHTKTHAINNEEQLNTPHSQISKMHWEPESDSTPSPTSLTDPSDCCSTSCSLLLSLYTDMFQLSSAILMPEKHIHLLFKVQRYLYMQLHIQHLFQQRSMLSSLDTDVFKQDQSSMRIRGRFKHHNTLV